MIDEEKIEELMVIFQRDLGKTINKAEAKIMADWLLDYFKLIVEVEKQNHETLTK